MMKTRRKNIKRKLLNFSMNEKSQAYNKTDFNIKKEKIRRVKGKTLGILKSLVLIDLIPLSAGYVLDMNEAIKESEYPLIMFWSMFFMFAIMELICFWLLISLGVKDPTNLTWSQFFIAVPIFLSLSAINFLVKKFKNRKEKEN